MNALEMWDEEDEFLLCDAAEADVWISCRERSCTTLMKKAEQLDGEPSASASLGGVHYYTLLRAHREKKKSSY